MCYLSVYLKEKNYIFVKQYFYKMFVVSGLFFVFSMDFCQGFMILEVYTLSSILHNLSVWLHSASHYTDLKFVFLVTPNVSNPGQMLYLWAIYLWSLYSSLRNYIEIFRNVHGIVTWEVLWAVGSGFSDPGQISYPSIHCRACKWGRGKGEQKEPTPTPWQCPFIWSW